jgi:uncharacterized membrane protein YbhN (UPF0104 family)
MLSKKIIFIFFIQVFAILYVTFIAAMFGFGISQIFDKYIFQSDNIKIDEKSIKKKPLYKILIKPFLILALYGVFAYFFRNIIVYIPFPLNGYYGFKYKRLKEVTNGSVFIIVMLTFSETLSKLYSQIKIKMDIN